MEDLIQATNTKSKGRRRSAKVPRIDLTPMVDLGFLLITFFIFTTSLARPKVMALQMPYDGPVKNPTAWPGESTITIIPVAAHRVIIYDGSAQSPGNVACCGFEGKSGLRERISLAKRGAASLPANLSKEAHQLHVLIKPAASSRYEDLVRLLDEMSISDVPFYVLAKPAEPDKNLIAAYGK